MKTQTKEITLSGFLEQENWAKEILSELFLRFRLGRRETFIHSVERKSRSNEVIAILQKLEANLSQVGNDEVEGENIDSRKYELKKMCASNLERIFDETIS